MVSREVWWIYINISNHIIKTVLNYASRYIGLLPLLLIILRIINRTKISSKVAVTVFNKGFCAHGINHSVCGFQANDGYSYKDYFKDDLIIYKIKMWNHINKFVIKLYSIFFSGKLGVSFNYSLFRTEIFRPKVIFCILFYLLLIVTSFTEHGIYRNNLFNRYHLFLLSTTNWVSHQIFMQIIFHYLQQ